MNPVMKNKTKHSHWKGLMIAVVIACILAAAGWEIFRMLVAEQDISKLAEPLPAATILYEASGKEASRIALGTIEAVRYESLPKS
ncbi:hypothetical protein K0U00_21825, partial [Paenibacillus sepulcri]|nr:hypothetical protein [Paenibacillus sepulcri]